MRKFTIRIFAFIFLLYIVHFTLYIPVYAQQATLSLSPSSGTFNKSCPFSLEVKLNTGSAQSDGTDAILIYDTSRFSATSISSGTIYPDYPGNSIDEQAGKITISGLASIQSAFSGEGTLATVNFRVKDDAQAGATKIRFDFDPKDKAKTTDSNVVERGTVADILNSVVDGNYTVGTGVCPGATPTPRPGVGAPPAGAATPAATLAPTASPRPTATLPPAGSEQLTFTLTIVGVVLTILGILGLALL